MHKKIDEGLVALLMIIIPTQRIPPLHKRYRAVVKRLLFCHDYRNVKP